MIRHAMIDLPAASGLSAPYPTLHESFHPTLETRWRQEAPVVVAWIDRFRSRRRTICHSERLRRVLQLSQRSWRAGSWCAISARSSLKKPSVWTFLAYLMMSTCAV